MRLKYKFAFLIIPFLLSSCSWETNIKGYVIFSDQYKLVKEDVDDAEVEEKDKLFLKDKSDIYLYDDFTFSLRLTYKLDDVKIEVSGDYLIEINSLGHSGDGYICFNDEKIDVQFENNYYIYFYLPIEWNQHDQTENRKLCFQRWGRP